MIQIRSLLLVSAAALLTCLAAVPTADAADGCTVDAWTWELFYDCEAAGVGAAGTVEWCPDPLNCRNIHVIGCYLYLGMPWNCWT